MKIDKGTSSLELCEALKSDRLAPGKGENEEVFSMGNEHLDTKRHALPRT